MPKVFIILLLSGFQGFCQIVVTGTPVNQTCPGNGSITFTAQNINNSFPVTYTLYLLPDTTLPVSESTNPVAQSLSAGTYTVTASQTINGSTTSGTSTPIVIQNLYTAPDFKFDPPQNTHCGNDGKITAILIAGNIITYELLGPENRPPQASPEFDNLPAGIYTVLAKDACGTVIPHTITIFSDVPELVISEPVFPDAELPACDLITLSNIITPATDLPLIYPYTVVIKLYPPQGGTPIIYNQVITTGAEDTFTISQVIPFYYDTNYFYDIAITNTCGTVYSENNNLIRQKLTITAEIADAGCGTKYIKLTPSKYVGPYTISFTNPAGFNALLYNDEHPGPFTGPVTEYGQYENGLPFGIYNFTLLDACNRTVAGSTELEFIPAVPLVTPTNTNCEDNLGKIKIIINGYSIEGGTLVATTATGFTGSLPMDITQYVNADGEVEIADLPPGTYTFTVIDECGNEYTDIVTVIPDFQSTLNAFGRPGCEPGTTGVSVTGNKPLVSVKITAAPPGFDQVAMPLPYDISSNITGGILYMKGLPPGAYTFTAINDCGAEKSDGVTLYPYEVTENTMHTEPHCGSFDLIFNHVSNGTAFLSFWLQKQLDNGTWSHPFTAVPYPENTIPTEENSLLLVNNTYTYSITQTGNYRILKRFRSFGNGEIEECYEVLHEFPFTDDLVINSVSNLSCPGALYNIEVSATGVEPLTYIIKNESETFIHDNGTNNIFSNLAPDTYRISVLDPCGNQKPLEFNIADLPALVTATTPQDLYTCDADNNGIDTFTLTQRNNEILGNQNPDMFLLTYHATQHDADTGLNVLPEIYTTGAGTIYARVEVTTNNGMTCHSIVPLELKFYESPEPDISPVIYTCEGSPAVLNAGPGFSSYLWSTGAVTQSITVYGEGIYTVKVTNTNNCETTRAVTVINSVKPEITRIESTDWTENSNTITILVKESAHKDNFEYSIDGENYQRDNRFTGLAPGMYTVHVRDGIGCGQVSKDVWLLYYPKYFTPNDDTFNDFWQIPNAMAEPGIMIYVYDRYGKLITGFTPNSTGWDGTLNGYRLPATDYWFVVERPDGRVHKGHFAMIR